MLREKGALLAEKWNSRKLFVLGLQFLVLILLPAAYKHLEISETVLLTVLAATSTLSGAYLGLNVLQKRIIPPDLGDV